MENVTSVKAVKDIVTGKGFKVAHKGDVGKAQKGVSPHETDNFGRILVFFNGRRHGYWVRREALQFSRGVKAVLYIAQRPPPKDPYAGVPKMPKGSVLEYHFGYNLRVIRRSRRVSQAELSNRIGVAQSAISYREQQPHSPNGEFISEAAKALSVPEFVFFLPMGDCDFFPEVRSFLSQLSSTICNS